MPRAELQPAPPPDPDQNPDHDDQDLYDPRTEIAA